MNIVLKSQLSNNSLLPEDGIPSFADGNKEWHYSGKLHRISGPAVELANGTKLWYKNGQLHREDGPAVEWANGGKEWWVNNKRHRTDGPAIELANGHKAWYINGQRHRIDGPAIEYVSGTKEWRVNGKLHREDGPAIENINGSKEWWLDGIRYKKEKSSVENINDQKDWHVNSNKILVDNKPIVDGKSKMNFFNLKIGSTVKVLDKGSKEELTATVINVINSDRVLLAFPNPVTFNNGAATHSFISVAEESLIRSKYPAMTGRELIYYYLTPNDFNVALVQDPSFKENHSISESEFRSLKYGDKLEVTVLNKDGNPVTLTATVIRSFANGTSVFYINNDRGVYADPNRNVSWRDLASSLGLNPDSHSFSEVDVTRYKNFFLSSKKIVEDNVKKDMSTVSKSKEVNSEVKTEQKKSKTKIVDLVKNDIENAAYRVASTQLTNGIKAGILMLLKDKGMDETKVSVFQEFLETEFGAAIISTILGYGLTYAPHINEDERVKHLAQEFRVQGMSRAGNEIISAGIKYLMPSVNDVIGSLPQTSTKVRVNDLTITESSEDNSSSDIEVTVDDSFTASP